jgi:NADPH-dependent 2,4-dienoyl-CoA reductase/sulfur reductase-like enzyme
MNKRQPEFEVVVVGAGPAGIAAACVAAESGKRVALLETTSWLGGQIWRSETAQQTPRIAQHWLRRLQASGTLVLSRTTVVGATRSGVLLAESSEGAIEVTWQKLILAVGARELFLPFPGWTLPNVMGPGGLQVLVKAGWPIAGKRVVIAGSGPLLIAAAAHLREAGAKVIAVAEQAIWAKLIRFGLALPGLAPGKLLQGVGYQLQLLGVPYRAGCWPVSAQGGKQLESVTLCTGEKRWIVPCDYLACGFGLIPNVELPQLLGCRLEKGAVWVNPWQETSVRNVYCAGEPTGIGGVDRALIEGQIAGFACTGQAERAEPLLNTRQRTHRFTQAMNQAFALRGELQHLATADTIVCRCEDLTRNQLELYDGWRAAKLHTRCGMGPCQGRICGGAARVLLGWEPESVRPPVFPTRVATLMEMGSGTSGQSSHS